MRRRTRIRTKILAALALPIAALAGVTVVEVTQGLQAADDVQEQARLAKAASGPNGLVTAIQNERNRAAVDLLGQGAVLELPVADNAEARRSTDSARDELTTLIAGQGERTEDTFAPALEALDELDQLRAEVDADQGPFDLQNTDASDPVFAGYTELIDNLLTANARLSLAIDDPELRRGAELAYRSSLQTDLMARLVRTLLVAGVSGGIDRADLREAGGTFGLASNNYATIRQLAVGDYAPLAEKLIQEEEAAGLLDRVAPESLETGEVVDLPGLLGSVSVPEDEGFYGFREGVRQTLDADADELIAAAERRAWLFQGLALLVVGVAALAAWLVSRSITRPLRALTRQATEMANHRLPDAVLDILDTPLGDDVTVPGVDPVHVLSHDEVADVAGALNTVQDSALDLAVEQAVLRRNIADSFVNLGRRNQNLLGRQLDFITELEHNETEPDTLANLFRLDHLATRMRRNAESLLVLAGIDPPRKWAAPVRITDAIRAALGEVEDYQRVTVRAVEPATILGNAAADLAHLLAELIENALIFSPPDQTVDIHGHTLSSGAPANGAPANGYTLSIVDAGLGMSPEDLAAANRRLAGAESFTIAPSKYLGHYVAGNLAARHNINVTLHSPGHGITATINLPPTVLADQTGDGPTPASGSVSPVAPDLPAAAAPPPPSSSPNGHGPRLRLTPRTASGLAKRTPRVVRPSTQPGAPPSGPVLDALATYTGQPGSPERTAGGLTRRIRGAQLPNTRPPGRRPRSGPSEPGPT